MSTFRTLRNTVEVDQNWSNLFGVYHYNAHSAIVECANLFAAFTSGKLAPILDLDLHCDALVGSAGLTRRRRRAIVCVDRIIAGGSLPPARSRRRGATKQWVSS